MRLKEDELNQLLLLWRARKVRRTDNMVLGPGFVPNRYFDAPNDTRISANLMKKLVDLEYARLQIEGVQPFWKITTKGVQRLLNPESLIVDDIMDR